MRESTECVDAVSTPPARGSAPWRTARTHSGNFEGVLGFGQSQPAPLNSSTSEVPPSNGTTAGWRERQEKERQEIEKVEEKEEPGFGKGGGPGWGNGQKKWRLAAGADTERVSPSVRVLGMTKLMTDSRYPYSHA